MSEISDKTRLASLILQQACQVYAPVDTGNLMMNAIKIAWRYGTWCVIIGGEVAPYAYKTNEMPQHYHWIENAIESVRFIIEGVFKGEYTEESLTNFMNHNQELIQQTLIDQTTGVLDYDYL